MNKLINEQCFKYVDEDTFNGGMFVFGNYHLCTSKSPVKLIKNKDSQASIQTYSIRISLERF